MDILNWFTSYFGRKFPEIKHWSFIKIVLDNEGLKPKTLINRDWYYRLYSDDTVERKLNSIIVDLTYVAESSDNKVLARDCEETRDDIKSALKRELPQMAVAIVDCFSPNKEPHACLGYINDKQKFKIIEINKQIKSKDKYDIYLMEF